MYEPQIKTIEFLRNIVFYDTGSNNSSMVPAML